jgi:heptosyltransferase-2
LVSWKIPCDVTSHSLNIAETDTLAPYRQHLNNSIALAPSAAWELKRWPIEYWVKLIQLLPLQQFTLLGGPDDRFCQEIADSAPDRTLNLAGKLSWLESSKALDLSRALVSGDTGLMHISDFLGKPTIALIGPSAFGYPSRSKSHVLEIELPCKPCSKDGRGKCRYSEYKHCMLSIKPEQVAQKLLEVLE